MFRENLTISLIIVRGPSTWVEQDAIYMRVLAPKENVLHPFYILGSFNETKNRFLNLFQLESEFEKFFNYYKIKSCTDHIKQQSGF